MRYLYRPVTPVEQVQHQAMRDVVDSFFSGSPLEVIVALLDGASKKMTDDDFKRLEQFIEKTRKEGR